MRVACAAARQLQVHRRRVQACVQEKKSQAGPIGSGRTIKKSRRESATRCRPGRCAPSERRVKNYDARLRMAKQASRAFESNTTRDAVKLSLMHFEIARQGHRNSVATQECGDAPSPCLVR